MNDSIIYADHAATTRLSDEAYQAMRPFFQEIFSNASQSYSFARPARKALMTAREMIAEQIRARPDEIYFTSGGTESDNWAIKCAALSPTQEDRRTILTSAIEHHAVLNSCATMERQGFSVNRLPVDGNGVLTENVLLSALNSDARLVSIMLANNEVGTIEPVQRLCALAHKYGVLFHTDAVQAVGHIPVDVKKLGVDFLSASAHKFYGPKGIGFLYVRDGVSLDALHDGGKQEHGLRAGTENIAAIVGMAYALKSCCQALESEAARLQGLEELLLKELQGLDFICNGSEKRLPGLLSLSFRGISGETLLHRLDLMKILVSTGAACNSENLELSHVLSAMGVSKEYAMGTIRISLGQENGADDIHRIAKAIRRIMVA